MSAPTAAIKALRVERERLLEALDVDTKLVSSWSQSIARAGENITRITSEVAAIEAAIVTLGGAVDAEATS